MTDLQEIISCGCLGITGEAEKGRYKRSYIRAFESRPHVFWILLEQRYLDLQTFVAPTDLVVAVDLF
jgi:hypothetical protein